MMDQFSPTPEERLRELLTALVEGELTDAEQTELEQLVADDPAARDQYVDILMLHALLSAKGDPLSAIGGQPSAQDETERSSAASPSLLTPRSSFETFIRGHNFAIAMAVAFAALAAVVTWMGFSYLPGVAENENKPAAEAQDEVIAQLVRVHDIEWADGGVPASTQYKSGTRLAFTKGLVEIRYMTGAAVVIEGPAEYFVGTKDQGERRKDQDKDSSIDPLSSGLSPSENSGHLALGNLVARCDTKASQGFTVCTPYACIEDHGTEFGVDVDEQGAAEFVVVTGAVNLIGGRDGSEQRVRLVKDEGAFVAKGGAITRRTQVDMQLVAAMRSRLMKIREVPTPVVSDAAPTLIAHYEFEDGPGSSKATDSSGNGHTGTLKGGAAIVNDPERGNVYQYQRGSQSHADIDSTVAIPSLPPKVGATLAVWVRRDKVDVGSDGVYAGALALGRDGDNPIMMISVANDGAVCGFLEGDKGGMDQIRLTGPAGAVANGVWTHVAISFDRVNNVAKMFVNGTQSGKDIDISLAGDGVLDWTHANVGYLEHPTESNFFPGLIDDARFYYGVLTAEEVQSLMNK